MSKRSQSKKISEIMNAEKKIDPQIKSIKYNNRKEKKVSSLNRKIQNYSELLSSFDETSEDIRMQIYEFEA